MFVIKASTPEAMRDEIVKWLRHNASIHSRAAQIATLKRTQANELVQSLTYEQAAKFLEGCEVESGNTSLSEAMAVIKPFSDYEKSDVFRVVYQNAPDNLYVMRNDNGHKVTTVTVKDFRNATAFLTKS